MGKSKKMKGKLRQRRPKAEDIMSKSDSEKEKIYERLERSYGRWRLSVKEHKSGFPAVVIKVDGEPRYITDCLSLEDWWRKKKGS